MYQKGRVEEWGVITLRRIRVRVWYRGGKLGRNGNAIACKKVRREYYARERSLFRLRRKQLVTRNNRGVGPRGRVKVAI